MTFSANLFRFNFTFFTFEICAKIQLIFIRPRVNVECTRDDCIKETLFGSIFVCDFNGKFYYGSSFIQNEFYE